MKQFAFMGSSSPLRSEACSAIGASDGAARSRMSHLAACLRAAANASFINIDPAPNCISAVRLLSSPGNPYPPPSPPLRPAKPTRATTIARSPKLEQQALFHAQFLSLISFTACASHHSLCNAPIFHILIKLAVNGAHQCDFRRFSGHNA